MAGGEIAAIIGEVLKWLGIIGGSAAAILLSVRYAEAKGAAEDDVEEFEAREEERNAWERDRIQRRRESIDRWREARRRTGED